MTSSGICEISKNSFFYRTPLVAASVIRNPPNLSFQRPEISKDSEAATRGVLCEKVFL